MQQTFGHGSRIWLFGSRTDDSARGGDIDLYVETPVSGPDRVAEAKIALLTALQPRLGERRIDLVVRCAQSGVELPDWRHARETGIELA